MRSEICIFDMSTHVATSVLQTGLLVESPNWIPDQEALIVNCYGRLYRVDLHAPELDEINTDFAVICNNDHGVSPDGRQLAISDSTEDGLCNIYTLPVGGGRPKRITENPPSYWQGWSPDGAMLSYVGRRNDGAFNVFTIPADGGEETCLTRGFEHTDGAEFSPDGKLIWFNGQRGTTMQLWRMNTDGSALEQMTDDDRANWFPHPSPDGKVVIYLSFEPGTKGHPRDRAVKLRALAATGGAPQDLLSVFGGQGTLNVPSWAADSNRFAFIRYDPVNE